MRPEIIRGKGFTHDSGYVSLFQIYVSDKTLFFGEAGAFAYGFNKHIAMAATVFPQILPLSING